jgi:hypothetical protein
MGRSKSSLCAKTPLRAETIVGTKFESFEALDKFVDVG